jgi:hypothetical protein
MTNNLKLKISYKHIKPILVFFFFMFALTIDVNAKDFQPIGTVNPSKYIPAQKQIAGK